jgi:hypothetical protein
MSHKLHDILQLGAPTCAMYTMKSCPSKPTWNAPKRTDSTTKPGTAERRGRAPNRCDVTIWFGKSGVIEAKGNPRMFTLSATTRLWFG